MAPRPPASGQGSGSGRVRHHLSIPLFRNAYALVAASALTSVLGLIYWGVAARRYPEIEVGRGGAAVAALLLIGGASQLNLTHILPRFLPAHGEQSRRLVVLSYGAATAAAVVIGGIFVTLGGVDSSLGGTGSPWPARAAFVAAVVAWNMFTLQDAVLAGIRQSVWVPVENGLFAATKVALVWLLAGHMPRSGIFTSWSVPAAVIAVPVSIVLMTRLLPAHQRSTAHREAPPSGDLLRYSAADYLGGLFQLASVNLMPLLVAAIVGLRANAAFATAWIAASAFDLALASVGVLFTVEGANDEDRIHALLGSTVRLSGAITAGGVAAIMVLAPTAMSILGEGYEAGADVLRLLALAMPFRAALTVFLSVARLRRRLVAMIATQAASCTIAVALAAYLLPRQGITGAALGYAVAQAVVAVAVIPTITREIQGAGHHGRPKHPGPAVMA